MASTLLSSITNLTSKILSTIQGSSGGGDIKGEMDKLSRMVSGIRATLADAEEREITDEFQKLWLHHLKCVAYDAEDILSDFHYNLLSMELDKKIQIDNRKRKFEVIGSTISPSYDASFLSRIKKVTEQFNEISHARNTLGIREEDGLRRVKSSVRTPSSSFVDHSGIFGRESDQERVTNALINIYEPRLDVIALVAMGGMGKTTVAKLVFNSEIVQRHFELKSWVWVSEFCNEITITKSIIESITKQECGFCQLDALQSRLREILRGRKFLLVLDDIWNEDKNFWKVVKLPLNFGAKGSRILITTENHKVAKCMGTNFSIDLDGLSKSESWALFSHHAFYITNPKITPSQILLDIGEKIVDKCNGVPLVLRTLGGLLASSADEQVWRDLLQSNAWELEEYRSNTQILNLSYHGLPPHLKPCFRSCAMFPKGHEFETDSLVRIWAAHGLIEGEDSNQIEVGRGYVNDLLQRSFFQKVTQGTKSKLMMHDLMHDLSKQIVGGESVIIEGDELGKKGSRNNFRHLTVVVKKDKHISFEPFQGCLPLRSLLIHSYNQTRFHLDRHFFNHEFLQYLHVLDLNIWKSRELPETVGNLKHLRFLGLSGQSLPESICSLLNLQTLDLRTRGNYINLPTNINRLQSLRHLIVSPWDVSKIPSGIGCLTNLQTLSVFAVSRDSGSATINELKNLNNLRDELHITGLHHILHGDMVYSMDPDLASKKKLTHLFLHWSTFVKSKPENNDEKLLDVLRPHTNIQHVVVEGYRGSQLPSWFEDHRFSSITYLEFDNCTNCTKLPAVGQLPMLRHLKLERLKGLRIVRKEFYGNSNISFPSLETLSFYDMPELEKWCYRDGGGSPFPCLRELHVSLCPKLRSFRLSNLPALQRCSFNWCDKLASISGLNTEWSKRWYGVVDTRICHLQDKNNSFYKFQLLNGNNPYHVLKRMTIIACPLLQGFDDNNSISASEEDHENLAQPEEPKEIASTSAGLEVSEAAQFASEAIPVNSHSMEPRLISTPVRLGKRKEVIWHDKNNRLKNNVLLGTHCAVPEETTIPSEEDIEFGEETQQEKQHEGNLSLKERRENLDEETDSSTNTFLHMWANSICNTFLSGFSFFKSLPARRNPPVEEVRRTSL